MMKKIEEEKKTEVKFNAFGKTRICRKGVKANVKPTNVSIDNEEADCNLIKKQSAKIEEQILSIKSQNLGRVGNIFKMRDAIDGPKKGGQEPTAVRDPKSDDLIVSNDEIKKVTPCVDNLKKQPEDQAVVKGLELRKVLHHCRMDEDDDDEEFYIGKDDFN